MLLHHVFVLRTAHIVDLEASLALEPCRHEALRDTLVVGDVGFLQLDVIL